MSGECEICGNHTLECEMINQKTWIKIKDQLPKLSYVESDNADDPYECYPILVYSEEKPGIFCVAYLVKNQDENDTWNFGELSWELYIPGGGGDIIEKDFETFTHWMSLPKPPYGNLRK